MTGIKREKERKKKKQKQRWGLKHVDAIYLYNRFFSFIVVGVH